MDLGINNKAHPLQKKIPEGLQLVNEVNAPEEEHDIRTSYHISTSVNIEQYTALWLDADSCSGVAGERLDASKDSIPTQDLCLQWKSVKVGDVPEVTPVHLFQEDLSSECYTRACKRNQH